jgi:hypothetical protein
MEQIKRKRNPEDHSSEINMELDQLIALGELLRAMPTPGETRDEFFPGLADLIAGGDRIKGMLDSSYDYFLAGGIKGELERREAGVE